MVSANLVALCRSDINFRQYGKKVECLGILCWFFLLGPLCGFNVIDKLRCPFNRTRHFSFLLANQPIQPARDFLKERCRRVGRKL